MKKNPTKQEVKAMFPEIALSPVKPDCPRTCPDRAFDCHAHCETYAKYREKCDAALKEMAYKREGDKAVADAMKRIPGKRAI